MRDISERKSAEKKKDELILELQNALAEIKTLRGFIPICSHCKKIRNDSGFWEQIESYLRDHAEYGLLAWCLSGMHGKILLKISRRNRHPFTGMRGIPHRNGIPYRGRKCMEGGTPFIFDVTTGIFRRE